MVGKLIGAVIIMASCGGYGFFLAYQHQYILRLLKQLHRILDRMGWELQYRLRPIPELCRCVSSEQKGVLAEVFLRLAIELENQMQPDCQRCMFITLESTAALPKVIKSLLNELGNELGRYDLHGQLEGINSVLQLVLGQIRELERDKGKRVLGYKTLGLCAGAALVILFI